MAESVQESDSSLADSESSNEIIDMNLTVQNPFDLKVSVE